PRLLQCRFRSCRNVPPEHSPPALARGGRRVLVLGRRIHPHRVLLQVHARQPPRLRASRRLQAGTHLDRRTPLLQRESAGLLLNFLNRRERREAQSKKRKMSWALCAALRSLRLKFKTYPPAITRQASCSASGKP